MEEIMQKNVSQAAVSDLIDKVHSPNQLQNTDPSDLIVQGLQRKRDKDNKEKNKERRIRKKNGPKQGKDLQSKTDDKIN